MGESSLLRRCTPNICQPFFSGLLSTLSSQCAQLKERKQADSFYRDQTCIAVTRRDGRDTVSYVSSSLLVPFNHEIKQKKTTTTTPEAQLSAVHPRSASSLRPIRMLSAYVVSGTLLSTKDKKDK